MFTLQMKKEIVSDVNTEYAKMYLNIKVKEAGYLKKWNS